jgi:hypothetical protein
MALDFDTKLRQGQDHVATSIGDETAVMSIKRGRYYAVGSVAERIWLMLEAPVSPREIAECLLEEYDITPEQCAREIDVFLNELIEEGLVVEHQP